MISRELLIEKLRAGNVIVRFTKADGTERAMQCTLQPDVIVPYEKVDKESTHTKSVNEDLVSVWDIEKDAWRSFKISSLTSVEC